MRYNTPEFPGGDSASEFLRMFGKNTNGGRNSAFTTFKKQVQAISACRMTLGFSVDGQATTYKGQLFKVRTFFALRGCGVAVGVNTRWLCGRFEVDARWMCDGFTMDSRSICVDRSKT